MLAIVFTTGSATYALHGREVVEVVPAASTRKLPHAPPYIHGVLNFRGKPVPIIDLCQLTIQRACHNLLSTRIILVHYPSHKNPLYLLGLMAENVVETRKIDDKDRKPAGIHVAQAPYLGDVVPDKSGMLQVLHLEELLPLELRESLFVEQKA